MVSGKVISKEKQEVVDFATVYLKGTTYGCTTNEEGIYHLHAPAGKYTLYNPQIEMFARFKMKSSFHKTKRII